MWVAAQVNDIQIRLKKFENKMYFDKVEALENEINQNQQKVQEKQR